jgi:hypothetical protein
MVDTNDIGTKRRSRYVAPLFVGRIAATIGAIQNGSLFVGHGECSGDGSRWFLRRVSQ